MLMWCSKPCQIWTSEAAGPCCKGLRVLLCDSLGQVANQDPGCPVAQDGAPPGRQCHSEPGFEVSLRCGPATLPHACARSVGQRRAHEAATPGFKPGAGLTECSSDCSAPAADLTSRCKAPSHQSHTWLLAGQGRRSFVVAREQVRPGAHLAADGAGGALQDVLPRHIHNHLSTFVALPPTALRAYVCRTITFWS